MITKLYLNPNNSYSYPSTNKWSITFEFMIFCYPSVHQSLGYVRLSAIPWTVKSMEFSRPEYWSGQPFPSPGDLPNPGIKSRFPTLQADSRPAEPSGKPKNTGVGSLSLLQWIFPIQESNQGLLHCRWILYQLSYEGSRDLSPRIRFFFWRGMIES